MKRIGTLLKKEREKKGISIERLSRKSGYSLNVIKYIEKNKHIPKIETIEAIGTVLCLDIDYLINIRNLQKIRYSK